MLRSLFLAIVLLGALTACDGGASKGASTAGVTTPTPPASAPAADAAPAPVPSVPADIAQAPPRKARNAKPPRQDSPAGGDPGRPDGGMAGDPRDDFGPDEYAPDDPVNEPRLEHELRSDDRPARPIAARWDGLGDIELGSGVDEVRDAWPDELEGDDSEACFYLSTQMHRPAAAPALMFEDGRLVRFDVDTPALSAPGGGRVGMEAEEILDRYGDDVERVPHKYTQGEYLRVEHGDSVLLFETDEQGVVTEWRVGTVPQVDYVEGCS